MARLTSTGPQADVTLKLLGKSLDEHTDEELQEVFARMRGARTLTERAAKPRGVATEKAPKTPKVVAPPTFDENSIG